jgi:hypothetical protein
MAQKRFSFVLKNCEKLPSASLLVYLSLSVTAHKLLPKIYVIRHIERLP